MGQVAAAALPAEVCCDEKAADTSAENVRVSSGMGAYVDGLLRQPRRAGAGAGARREVTFGGAASIEPWERAPSQPASASSTSAFSAAAGSGAPAPPAAPGTPAGGEAAVWAKYFEDWDSLIEALGSGDTVLLRGSWLESLCVSGQTLPRRQDLPDEAIWGAGELSRDYLDCRRPTPRVLAISCVWLGIDHPDPDGVHLRRFVPLLRQFARRSGCGIAEPLAVYIDWCSVPQPPWTDADQSKQQRARKHAGLWFAHQLVEVWLLSDGRGAHGWARFERAAAMLAPKHTEEVLEVTRVPSGWTSWDEVAQACRERWRPPMLPAAFAQSVERAKFRVPSDGLVAAKKYSELFQRVMRTTRQLRCSDLGWGDTEVGMLVEVLLHCEHLHILVLHGNDIGAAGAQRLAAAVPGCPSLTTLRIGENRMPRWAEKELVAAWRRAGKDLALLDTLGQRPVSPMHAGSAAAAEFEAQAEADTPGSEGSDLDVAQVTVLAARQAAFEARITCALSRVKFGLDGLAATADAVCDARAGLAPPSPSRPWAAPATCA